MAKLLCLKRFCREFQRQSAGSADEKSVSGTGASPKLKSSAVDEKLCKNLFLKFCFGRATINPEILHPKQPSPEGCFYIFHTEKCSLFSVSLF
ncbi:hypothetical protein JT26_07445 [Porphyromonas sp. COT-108 OH1349]|nr:hypothetical protein JT26_07445 [Porphyromonas sp. COT-108 OH1349]